MTNPTRDLLIRLSSHMAYMQGHLEAFTQQSDPEDYYWYRQSVALRQKVIDALAEDGPAVPKTEGPINWATYFVRQAVVQEQELKAALVEPKSASLEQGVQQMQPFVVRHYTEDERPTIKGNGFDGLEIGEDREEAEAFVTWINEKLARLGQ